MGRPRGRSLSLLRNENKLRGFGRRDRRSWKIKEEIMVKQEDTDMVVKKDDNNADSLDLDLPSIDHIIDSRSLTPHSTLSGPLFPHTSERR